MAQGHIEPGSRCYDSSLSRDAHAHPANRDAGADGNANVHADANHYTNGFADANRDLYAHPDAQRHANGHAHSQQNAYVNPQSISYGNSYANAHSYAKTNSGRVCHRARAGNWLLYCYIVEKKVL